MTARAVHVHLAGARVSVFRDAAPRPLKALYDDLANRMAAALEELLAQTHDEDKGHEFHGNQYIEVAGSPKPTTAEGKSAKEKIYGLLASGHPFTADELMTMAGLKPKKFTDYIAMLKNPKYAGKAGALQIVKNADGTYQVALADGSKAPGLQGAEAAPVYVAPPPAPPQHKKLTDKEIGTIKAHALKGAAFPDANWANGPEGVWQQAMDAAQAGDAQKLVELKALVDGKKKAPKMQALVSGLLDEVLQGHQAGPGAPISVPVDATPAPVPEAPQETLPKPLADAAYKKKVDAALSTLQGQAFFLEGNDAMDFASLALQFKEAKAQAMAEWATATSGTKQKAKPQEAFGADLQLVKDLKAGKAAEAAFAEWKSNTAKEKAGTWKFGQKVEPPKPPLAPAGKPLVLEPQDAPESVPYENLHPPGWKGIGPDDISSKEGFAHGIGKLEAFLESASTGSAQGNKKTVETRLRDRLLGSKVFQALKARIGGEQEGPGSLEARLISTWAGSSGDGNVVSCALQEATRHAFNLPKDALEVKRLTSIKTYGEEGIFSAAAEVLRGGGGPPVTDVEVPAIRAGMVDFLKAQHAETQEALTAAGIEHVYLARGMKFKHDVDPAVGPGKVKLQPASSFSARYSVAKNFASGQGTVFITKVPRQQVLGTYVTGFGCSGEHEVVVLGHHDFTAYTVSGGAHANVAETAQQNIRQRMKGTK